MGARGYFKACIEYEGKEYSIWGMYNHESADADVFCDDEKLFHVEALTPEDVLEECERILIEG